MDADKLFIGSQHKLISESSLKCNIDDVNQLLSIKKRILEQPRIEKCASLAEAEWNDDLKLAKLTKVTKNLTKNFSHSLNKSLYLYPEECLCLLEMKCLLLKWNERKLSIKNAFSLLLAAGSGCTFEQCRTYGYLVKLGFRVFKHDNKLKNNTHDSKDVSKLPDLSTKRKKKNANYRSIQTENSPRVIKKIPSPKLKTHCEIIFTPQSHYMPQNLQPLYDVYSYNLAVISGSVEIIDSKYFEEKTGLDNLKEESIMYKSQPIGMYPVYEKNIPQTIKSDEENIFGPRTKRLKFTEIKRDHSLNTLTMTASTSINAKNLSALSSTKNLTMVQDCVDLKNNKIMEINSSVGLSTGNNFSAFNNKISFSNKLLDGENNEKNQNINDGFATNLTQNVNLSREEKNEPDSKLPESTLSDDIPVEELPNMHINVPSHIRQKLLAIKPSTLRKGSTKNVNNKHSVHYDVYYPDNDVPKTLRPAPDFRVIVFEDDLECFPNIYDINISNPNDNIPTLWAIVNSSSVSFFSVDSIILPKTADWDKKDD
ncbi:uncharacterized protein LOC100160892 [Acyrthosiphon pisum]|uniref:tRNA-splicing endonuclease subunit Sen54 N-terminal domain-containing protein n=1 Tax=Acyrthosiphon pisum TaxID=7029 RepID=A0A8R2B641_ACYPI|nr:uncharacterized protein LOC100160892 [Acyrthosiphon pisum]|eukprot:XP_008183477.1 PREDICTED: uncharacterized protein LOC100160892 [Acyrthosiphon pisum]